MKPQITDPTLRAIDEIITSSCSSKKKQDTKIERHSESLFLTEEGTGAKVKKVEIDKIPEHYVAFKLDACGALSNILSKAKNNKGFNKGSDAILFLNLKGGEYNEKHRLYDKKVILICDLKSEYISGFDKQMKSSRAFIGYLKSITKEFFPEIDDFDKYTENIIPILFSLKAPKKKSRTRRKTERYVLEDSSNFSDLRYLKCPCPDKHSKFRLERIIEDGLSRA
jgi:hypothetical protein